MLHEVAGLGRGGLAVQCFVIFLLHFLGKTGPKLLSHNTHISKKKKKSPSPSKLIKLSELLDVAKITQGNRMSFNFLVSLEGELFAGGYMSVT